MECLTKEITEIIAINGGLNVEDVINMSSTCHQFRLFIRDNDVLWKKVFHKKYPQFAQINDHRFQSSLEQVQFLYKMKKKTIQVLKSVPQRIYFYSRLRKDDLLKWESLLEDELDYFYVVTVLREIVNNNQQITSKEAVPFETPGNLSLKYYAEECLHYVKHKHVTKKFKDFLSRPEEFVCEKRIILIAEWFQLDADKDDIVKNLDKLSYLVEHELMGRNPKHGIFAATVEEKEKWKKENLSENQWSQPECLQVVEALNHVMFIDLGYCQQVINFQANSLFVDEVLKNELGTSLLVLTIYQSVARRLGVNLDPIFIDGNLCLKLTTNGLNPSIYHLSVLDKGDIKENMGPPRESTTKARVFERLIEDLNQSANRRRLVSQTITSSLGELKSIMQSTLESSKLMDSYLMWRPQISNPPLEYSSRKCCSPDGASRKYKRGMIMINKMNEERCTIYDWVVACAYPPNLNNHERTIFYYVLSKKSDHSAVPEDALKPSRGQPPQHINLGRYFTHFDGEQFVPIDMLKEDEDIKTLMWKTFN